MPGVDDAPQPGVAVGANGGRSEGVAEGVAGALRSLRRALWVAGASWLGDPSDARAWASLVTAGRASRYPGSASDAVR